MVLPPTNCSLTASWLQTNYHDPRLGNFLFAFIFLLESICLAQHDLVLPREDKEKKKGMTA
jgi:hypothetical protein